MNRLVRNWAGRTGVLIMLLLPGSFARAVASSASTNAASTLSDSTLNQIKFDQKLNSRVRLDLPFRDENGNTVKLGDYLGKKPVILDLGYYRCPMLCTLVMNGMVECLQDLKMDIGKQFDVISVSIDPKETPALARDKKKTYLKRYGRDGAAAGWHFLTGDQPSIKALTAEVGFRYRYDPVIKQFAHPSGFIVLTPAGKVARYFFGIDYRPKEVDRALQKAGRNQTGSAVQQLILLCFHYSPLKGKYGNLIMAIVRASGVLTMIVLCGVVLLVTQRKRRRQREAANQPLVPREDSR
jgi:protein SCO1